MAPPPSRIGEARRRAADAKQAAVALAAAGFLAIALVARASHPGHASSATSTSTGSPVAAQSEDDDGLNLQGGQLAPSSGSSGGGAQTSVS
ncbi:MAG TPA: hypothetical protein VGP56_07125 [Gaiellaceae bacterium]|jgi:hypothetical protein|nr:hypothetical protein [Gaiellaceae bacterium]